MQHTQRHSSAEGMVLRRQKDHQRGHHLLLHFRLDLQFKQSQAGAVGLGDNDDDAVGPPTDAGWCSSRFPWEALCPSCLGFDWHRCLVAESGTRVLFLYIRFATTHYQKVLHSLRNKATPWTSPPSQISIFTSLFCGLSTVLNVVHQREAASLSPHRSIRESHRGRIWKQQQACFVRAATSSALDDDCRRLCIVPNTRIPPRPWWHEQVLVLDFAAAGSFRDILHLSFHSSRVAVTKSGRKEGLHRCCPMSESTSLQGEEWGGLVWWFPLHP